MQVRIRLLLLAVAVLALTGCAQAVKTEKTEAARTESIAGSNMKRVVLTEKAAERLGVETAPVRSEQVVRKQWIGALVTALPAGESSVASSQASVSSGEVLVRVKLSEGDLKRLDRNRPVAVRRVAATGNEAADLMAEPDSSIKVAADGKSASEANTLYYRVTTAKHGLVPGEPVFLELVEATGSAERKIVPFSALIYGLEGETWVYTRPAPLTFVRHPVTVDYIEGDNAILLEGPPDGSQVVTVAGVELFGVESGVGGGH